MKPMIFILLSLFTLLVMFDFSLTKYGKGWGLFSDRLIGNLHVNYNAYAGYEILEEDFIVVINTGTSIGLDTVRGILRYTVINDTLYTEVELNTSDTILIQLYGYHGVDGTYRYTQTVFPEDYQDKVSSNFHWISLTEKNNCIPALGISRGVTQIFFMVCCFGLLTFKLVSRTPK